MAGVDNAPLGKFTEYPSQYDPSLLFPIARSEGRNAAGIQQPLPFTGFDNWTGYEVSWLDLNGKPIVAIGYFGFAFDSDNIIESKSFKLYLNSFNMSSFASQATVAAMMEKDLSNASGSPVSVQLLPLDHATHNVKPWNIDCLDELPLTASSEKPDMGLIELGTKTVKAKWQTHLFRSLCPVTAQPDWASVRIEYQGTEIEPESLLAYLISYRTHQGFHEQCVEQIFCDLINVANPNQLLVEARFMRRGGLDINPVRIKGLFDVSPQRLSRQ